MAEGKIAGGMHLNVSKGEVRTWVKKLKGMALIYSAFHVVAYGNIFSNGKNNNCSGEWCAGVLYFLYYSLVTAIMILSIYSEIIIFFPKFSLLNGVQILI